MRRMILEGHDSRGGTNCGSVSVSKAPDDSKIGSHRSASESSVASDMTTFCSSACEVRDTDSSDDHRQSPKPFFIMDWLEQIDPADLELAQQMLKTPQRESRGDSPRQHGVKPTKLYEPKEGVNDELSPPRIRKVCGAGSSGGKFTGDISFFQRRSISIGNGWNAKGLAKAKKGMWEDALACWENALIVRTQVLGEEHIDVANTYNNIGIAHGRLEQPAEAICSLQTALEIRIKRYGEKHSQVAATLHNMGNVFQQSGELDSAVDFFSRAKGVLEQVFTHEHVQVARACVAMGHAYFQGKQYEKSHESFCEALVIFEHLKDGDGFLSEVEETRKDIEELEGLMYPSRN